MVATVKRRIRRTCTRPTFVVVADGLPPSRSIAKCVVQVVPQLLTAAASVLETSSASEAVAQHMIRACSSATQAMSEQSTEQLTALDRLLMLILERQRYSGQDVTETEAPRRFALAQLEELACMAEGLQPSRGRTFHVLDDDEGETLSQDQSSFEWINQRVLKSIARLLVPRDDGNILDAACQVLRMGYNEKAPGYFRFAPEVTANLVTTTPLSNPRLDEAIKTASFFLSSTTDRDLATNEAKIQLVHFIGEVINHIGPPQNDPILANACVTFVSKLVPLHMQLFQVIPEPLTLTMLAFTLQCLRKRTADCACNAIYTDNF